METEEVWRQFSALPPEAQREVADFIAILQIRYSPSYRSKCAKKSRLIEEPFIGLWKDRDDLQDSVSWVRDIRRRE